MTRAQDIYDRTAGEHKPIDKDYCSCGVVVYSPRDHTLHRQSHIITALMAAVPDEPRFAVGERVRVTSLGDVGRVITELYRVEVPPGRTYVKPATDLQPAPPEPSLLECAEAVVARIRADYPFGSKFPDHWQALIAAVERERKP